MSEKIKVGTYCRMANYETPKTALYCRVASFCDFAIKTQEESLCIYASEKRLSVGMVYTDNGVSGSSLQRPAFQEMMAAVDKGDVDCIIVKDLSRISRNYLQFAQWLDDMRSRKVRVLAINENFDSNACNVQNIPLAEAFAKYCMEVHSQKTKAGIANAKQRKLEQTTKHPQ